MSTNYYDVSTESVAEKLYLKSLRKKYKSSFNTPWSAFILMLRKFDLMIDRSVTSSISDLDSDIVIYKCEFKILPSESAKASGNRCIVAQYKTKKEVKILLVYCKNDIRGNNETVWWKKMIQTNYIEYKEIL